MVRAFECGDVCPIQHEWLGVCLGDVGSARLLVRAWCWHECILDTVVGTVGHLALQSGSANNSSATLATDRAFPVAKTELGLWRRMATTIHHMTVIRYTLDGRDCDAEQVTAPDWATIEAAVRRMDNYCFPIVQLNTTESDEASGIFNVCGGNGRWALFHMMGDWQYEDPGGGEDEVRLWGSVRVTTADRRT